MIETGPLSETASGTLGNSLIWMADDTNTLTISKIGLIPDFTYSVFSDIPWYLYVEDRR